MTTLSTLAMRLLIALWFGMACSSALALDLVNRDGKTYNNALLNTGLRCFLEDPKNFEKSPPTVALYSLVGSSIASKTVLNPAYQSVADKVAKGDSDLYFASVFAVVTEDAANVRNAFATLAKHDALCLDRFNAVIDDLKGQMRSTPSMAIIGLNGETIAADEVGPYLTRLSASIAKVGSVSAKWYDHFLDELDALVARTKTKKVASVVKVRSEPIPMKEWTVKTFRLPRHFQGLRTKQQDNLVVSAFPAEEPPRPAHPREIATYEVAPRLRASAA